MVYVTAARYESDYRVWVEFSDGASGVVDLQDDLWGPVFEPLKDKEQFKRFTVSEVFHTRASVRHAVRRAATADRPARGTGRPLRACGSIGQFRRSGTGCEGRKLAEVRSPS